MNPHSHDYRDTVRAGEKTGSPYQCDRAFRSKRFPPGAAVMIALVVSPFAWAAIIWAGMAVYRGGF